jgi:hypothetical protein
MGSRIEVIPLCLYVGCANIVSHEVAGGGYFSGNVNIDILWQNITTGERGIYLMNGTTVTGWGDLYPVPTQWQIQE